MPHLKPQEATGFQIAFFVIALFFLAAPADKYVFSHWQWARELGFPIGRVMTFVIAAGVLLAFPATRRRCFNLVSSPIGPAGRAEVAAGTLLNIVTAFAGAGIVGLWIWSAGGEAALARAVGTHEGAAAKLASALAASTIVAHFLMAGIVAPFVEELLFRGFLYPAWASRWGWVRSALATSLLFAVMHPNMYSQFMASIVFICLLRRTGSLRAPIIAHGVLNILLWHPFLGQYVFPGPGRDWTPQFICLALVVVALPLYMWMSRDEKVARISSTPDPAPARS